ncbi:MAG TPA: HAD family hydrolase, partial [Bacteroidetes bacterium]|nr:HAD family hydrolase [Bacteroidota bacterium]HEX04713.1 HAD family hydrolase [Bacteroidota bacterium]
VKANRFGYVMQAYHGTQRLKFDKQRRRYSRTVIEFRNPRFVFLNTLFSLSEACMFAQMVDKLDAGEIKDIVGYEELYRTVHQALDESHAEGVLKEEILAEPEAFIDRDPDIIQALLDQKQADKKLVLITNSDWTYTKRIMEAGFDPELPEGTTWRDLFDLVIVSARKPSFFDGSNAGFEVVEEEQGLLSPVGIQGLEEGRVYVGGNARMVEELWGFSGEQILYVGDHIYADVQASKSLLRWRTALVLREREGEIRALSGFRAEQAELTSLMLKKEELESTFDRIRMLVRRGEAVSGKGKDPKLEKFIVKLNRIRSELSALDKKIGPYAKAYGELLNPNWGLVLRAGNDKSLLARQVENFADIYMSRVSNFLYSTPYAYLRSKRSTLPHDREDASLSETGVIDLDTL